MKTQHQISMRKKIVATLPWRFVESLIDNKKRPWMFNRASLDEELIKNWDEDTTEEILRYLVLMLSD